MSETGRYDPEHQDGTHWEEKCFSCINLYDSYEDKKSCGSCFGVESDGTTRFAYKNFKKGK